MINFTPDDGTINSNTAANHTNLKKGPSGKQM